MSSHLLIKKSRASSFPIGLFATLLKTVLTSDLKIPELGSSNISNNLPTGFYYGIVKWVVNNFLLLPWEHGDLFTGTHGHKEAVISCGLVLIESKVIFSLAAILDGRS